MGLKLAHSTNINSQEQVWFPIANPIVFLFIFLITLLPLTRKMQFQGVATHKSLNFHQWGRFSTFPTVTGLEELTEFTAKGPLAHRFLLPRLRMRHQFRRLTLNWQLSTEIWPLTKAAFWVMLNRQQFWWKSTCSWFCFNLHCSEQRVFQRTRKAKIL